MPQDKEREKSRKSEAQKIYEEADNAGRFSGKDDDAKAAQQRAVENIRQDTMSSQEERNKDNNLASDYTDAEAHRDAAQTKDHKGEAQNVNDDTGRPLTDEEADHARNKSMEGMRQQRDAGQRSRNNDVNRDQNDQKGRG
jgi:hypothetical protein